MQRSIRRLVLTTAFGAFALSAQAASDATRRQPQLPDRSCLDPIATGQAQRQADPVLVEGLGYAGLEPDSDQVEARAWFAQGVRLVWAFDEAEAIRAFQQAQRLDPNCALCFFGEAWARGPTINLQPRTEELVAARGAARRALALSQQLGDRDRLLVQAMALRTRDGAAFNNRGYAAFMARAARRMPQDDTIAVMAADARMVLSPNIRPGSFAQQLLERVLARNPGHGGAIHFYIHLTDWIDRQALAVPYAERLGRIAPAASHLVHMPSHSFYGVGRYRDAAAVNVAAIAADSAYERRVRPPRSDYRTALRAHDMHFAMNSALVRGDAVTARIVAAQYRAEYLAGTPDDWGRLLGSSVYFTAGLHDDPRAVMALPEPSNALLKVFRHYARGEASARARNAGAVGAEARAIAAIRRGTAAPSLGAQGAKLAEVIQYVLDGRAAMLAGQPRVAEAAFRRAMERQLAGDFGNDPPLFWYSVRRSLAAARLAAGDPRGARAQLLASLRNWPDDPLALYVLSLAERRLGQSEAAERNLARARSIWAGDLTQIPLERI